MLRNDLKIKAPGSYVAGVWQDSGLPDDERFIPGILQHRGHRLKTKWNPTVPAYLGRQELLIVSGVISELFLTAGDKTSDSVIGFLKRCGQKSATKAINDFLAHQQSRCAHMQ
jgi:hypothetical protein